MSHKQRNGKRNGQHTKAILEALRKQSSVPSKGVKTSLVAMASHPLAMAVRKFFTDIHQSRPMATIFLFQNTTL